MDLNQIILGCQNKRPEAQKALVQKYSGLLFTICRRYCYRQMDARQGKSISVESNTAKLNFENCLILVAEDNPINQKYIKKILEKNNINFEFANDGQETVNKCKAKKYDLIFMDIQMPVMDGLEASAIIRKSENINQETCIIALTASALREDKHNALDAGMNGFLTKPFTPATLLEAMKKNLRQSL